MVGKKLIALPTVLLSISILFACRANQSLEGQARDARIAAQIKSRLASQVGATTLTSVEVNVTNGVATLAGPVHSAQESQQIEQVARGVEGVSVVKNALQILQQEVVTPPAAAALNPTPDNSASPR